jgi:cytochrome c
MTESANRFGIIRTPFARAVMEAVRVLVLGAIAWLVGLPLPSAVQAADVHPRLGVPITAETAARADPTVFADGRGLPPGRGNASEGQAVYGQRCASCHGPEGRGGHSGRLTRARSPLSSPPSPSASASAGRPADRTIAAFWPYATTLFDYIRRAMPNDRPGSLGDSEVYALTAYLLALDGIVAPEAEMSAASLPAVRMPNRDGFLRMDRPEPPRAR